MAGTGAFLLLVASAVFVASNWDQLPDAAKLALVGLLTGACLLGGRSLRAALPGTSGALSHLGALLVPVDVAALAVHLEAGPDEIALAQGLVAAPTLWLVARAQRSAILRGAAAAAVVVGAAGLGGVTGVPTGLLLAAAAVAAVAAGAPRAATGWAVVAGASPLAVLAGAGAAGSSEADWLARFALGGAGAGWSAIVTGGAAGAVLASLGVRRREPALGVLALAALAVGVTATWATADPPPEIDLVLVAGTLLLVQATATLLRRDPFWRPLLAPAAVLAEAVAALGTLAALVPVATVVAAPVTGDRLADPEPMAALAFALTAATWATADLRRRPAGLPPATPSAGSPASPAPGVVAPPGALVSAPVVALCLAAAVASVAAPAVLGVALAALAGLALASGRPGVPATAVVCASLAPVAAAGEPGLAAGLAAGGAVLLGWAAALRVEAGAPSGGSWALAMAVGLPLATGAAVLHGPWSLLPVLAGAVVVLWATALLLDRGDRHEATRGLGSVPRYASLLVLVPDDLPARHVGALAALLLVLTVIEVARRRQPDLGWSAAVTLPLLVLAAAPEAGTDLAGAGLVLTAAGALAAVAALAALGSAPDANRRTRIAGDRWGRLAGGLSATWVAMGGALAATDQWALATFLVMVGTALLGLGTLWREGPGGTVARWTGGLVLALGVEGHLTVAEVEAAEAYLAPVAVLLLAAGVIARRAAADRGEDPVSSWLAYGPAIGLVGVASLAERLDGGSAAHAAVAGAVGVAAVIAGGWRRLAAPLFCGTALVAAVAVHESLAVTAGVPTWAWLSLGGTVLLATGVALERTATSPLEGGRRLVEVISQRFE